MTLRLMIAAAVSAGLSAAACFPVTTARITGRDLALADPTFARLPATYTVALAPEPGMRRVLAAAELERIAAANQIPASHISEACFEVPMRALDAAAIEPAMRRALPAGAGLKVVELSKAATPVGDIEFPMTGLEPATPSSDGVQLWRGFVRYAETRRAPVWARVAIAQRYTCVVAARDLLPGLVIPAAALRVEERDGAPPREKIPAKIEEVAGRQVTRAVRSGDPVPAALLIAPWDVKRGDSIRVQVESGDARLNLDAIAENSAREGDMVELRNPSSGKVFRARLEQKGRAVLVLTGGPGL